MLMLVEKEEMSMEILADAIGKIFQREGRRRAGGENEMKKVVF